MKKILSVLLVLMMLTISAQAASNVTYEGGSTNFVFQPGGQYSATDLFPAFKGVMPGDVIVQRITLRNTSPQQVRIYLHAEPVEERHRAFLDKMNLQVTCSDQTIFDAAPSQTGQLTENVLLGTFKTAGTAELVATLTVPLDLGNEFMSVAGVVPWVFQAEVVPVDDTPHTGDAFDLTTWLLAAGMLLAAIGWVLVQMKRQQAQAD